MVSENFNTMESALMKDVRDTWHHFERRLSALNGAVAMKNSQNGYASDEQTAEALREISHRAREVSSASVECRDAGARLSGVRSVREYSR